MKHVRAHMSPFRPLLLLERFQELRDLVELGGERWAAEPHASFRVVSEVVLDALGIVTREHPAPHLFHPDSDVGPEDERCGCGRFHTMPWNCGGFCELCDGWAKHQPGCPAVSPMLERPGDVGAAEAVAAFQAQLATTVGAGQGAVVRGAASGTLKSNGGPCPSCQYTAGHKLTCPLKHGGSRGE